MNPPPSGPNDFPSPHEPLPPVTPAFGTTGGFTYPTDPTPPRGEISLDAISEAWKILQPNLGVWIGTFVAFLLITAAMQGVQYLVSPQLYTGQGGTPSGTAMGLYILVAIGSSLVNIYLSGGLYRMALENIRTGQVDMGLLFSGGNVFLTLFLAGILSYIILFLGFLCCIIPGIIASVGLILTTSIIVDQRVGALEAISMSWEAVKPQWLSALVLVLVLGLVNIAGGCLCGIGLLVTLPLSLLALNIVYLDLFKNGDRSRDALSGYPHSPIADPNA